MDCTRSKVTFSAAKHKAKRFRADNEFAGESSGRQNGVPVKFEKMAPSAPSAAAGSQDQFGLMLAPESGGAGGSRKTLAGVGGRRGGSMLAAAGASSRDQLMNSRAGASASLDSKFQSSRR